MVGKERNEWVAGAVSGGICIEALQTRTIKSYK